MLRRTMLGKTAVVFKSFANLAIDESPEAYWYDLRPLHEKHFTT
jgi:hypothetical protein